MSTSEGDGPAFSTGCRDTEEAVEVVLRSLDEVRDEENVMEDHGVDGAIRGGEAYMTVTAPPNIYV